MTGYETADFGGQKTAGVCGWPVAHSKSPLIHRFWLQKLGLDGDYVRLPVAPETAHQAFRSLPLVGLTGVNVTVPLKEIALKAADRQDESAAATGAANVLLVRPDRTMMAFNTDWSGFLEPLVRQGARPQTAVMIGAGGAARAVMMALNALGVEELTIVNRSVEKARALADGWPGRRAARVVELAAAMELPQADLVVNASSLGMKGQPLLDVRLDRLAAGSLVYDLVYAPLETGLLAAARARGAQTIDGLEMLVGQADRAFAMFYGAEPPRQHDAELRRLLTGGAA